MPFSPLETVRKIELGPAQVVHGEVSERFKVLDSKSSVARATGGSNPSLSANLLFAAFAVCSSPNRIESGSGTEKPGAPGLAVTSGTFVFGEVTERPKVHDWKSCVVQATGGSNPPLSAMPRAQKARRAKKAW